MIPVTRQFLDAWFDGGLLSLAYFSVGTLGKVAPIISAYTPALGLLIGDITLDTNTGMTAKAMSAIPTSFNDPGNGDMIVRLPDPAGGWFFHEDLDPIASYQVFGFALINAAAGLLVAVTEPLADPVTFNAAGQAIDAGQLDFRLTLAGVV